MGSMAVPAMVTTTTQVITAEKLHITKVIITLTLTAE